MKYNKENKTAARTRYYKFGEAAKGMNGKAIPVDKAMLWMRKGKYDATGVTIKYDPEEAISDWARAVKLENVELAFETSEDGKYTTLVIRGIGDVPF